MENNKINTLNVLKNNLKSFSDNNKNCNYIKSVRNLCLRKTDLL